MQHEKHLAGMCGIVRVGREGCRRELHLRAALHRASIASCTAGAPWGFGARVRFASQCCWAP